MRPVITSIHNEDASLVSLARTVLSGVDRRRLETAVQTGTLVLLIEKLIEVLEPKQAVATQETSKRSVRELIAAAETVIKNRDDDEFQARGGKAPSSKRAWS